MEQQGLKILQDMEEMMGMEFRSLYEALEEEGQESTKGLTRNTSKSSP